jgi:hypothetical protein
MRLMQLIETHTGPLTHETVQDLLTNERTRAFRKVPGPELEARVAALYGNLGKWIGSPKDDSVRAEYEEWGKARFRQGIPLSEIVYALILAKSRLRRYVREHGLVDFSGDRVIPGELLPVQLHSIQELNYMIGEFFDVALYHLARGYESVAGSER